MIARVLLLVAVAASASFAVAGGGQAAVVAPEPHCSPAPDACTGWFRGPVTVTWTYDTVGVTQTNCNVVSVTSDTTGAPVTCAVEYGSSGWVSRTITIRVDATAPVVSARPSRSADENGWYHGPVTVEASGFDATSGIASCSAPTYAGPDTATATATASCADAAGNVGSTSVAFRYDATGPTVTARPARSPDPTGWYRSPVDVAFAGVDAVSGVASCSSVSYAGPDAPEATVPGACTDQAGNRTATSFALRYDATAPVVTLAADRQPDGGGLYTRPLTLSATATDAVSGVAACDRPLNYRGPDRSRIVHAASCRDLAGNEAAKSLAFGYDTTEPVIASLDAKSGPEAVTLTWAVAGASVVEVVRTPGRGTKRTSIVYRGRATSFTDGTIANGRRYRYVVRALDSAGNGAWRAIRVTPRAGVFLPPPGALVGRRPLVAWVAVAEATFYNLQLYRGRRKVLTTWVTLPRYRLPASWLLGGRRERLIDGAYRVLVWPAFGTRDDPRFGTRATRSSFRVKARARS